MVTRRLLEDVVLRDTGELVLHQRCPAIATRRNVIATPCLRGGRVLGKEPGDQRDFTFRMRRKTMRTARSSAPAKARCGSQVAVLLMKEKRIP
jgi:hypothetical protein